MMKKLRAIIKRQLLERNYLVVRTVEKREVLDFIASVKPVRTDRDLIRIGGDTDGGYLVPDDLDGIEACFSPGVSDVATFEETLAKRGIRCLLADYSVDAPPVKNPLFDFEKKYLGPKETDMFMTLENWVSQKAPGKSDLILQMDIEGAEYGVIFDTTSETLSRFRIVVVEFHRLDLIRERMGFDLVNLAFTKLLKNFEVVHIHPNNTANPVDFHGIAIPPVMEFTFLRKDRIGSRTPATQFPHELDKTNVPYAPDFALPSCWYERPAGE
jgi:hypothetical protein